MLTEKQIVAAGFQFSQEDNMYIKIVNGRSVRCYKNPKDFGCWVCELDPMMEQARYDKIIALEELESFIKYTCNSKIKNAKMPDIEIP